MIPGTIKKNNAGIIAKPINPINVKYSPIYLRYLPSKIKKGEIRMKKFNIETTKMIIGGGLNLSGAIISAFKGFANTIFEIGQAVGGAIRRIGSGNLCKF